MASVRMVGRAARRIVHFATGERIEQPERLQRRDKGLLPIISRAGAASLERLSH